MFEMKSERLVAVTSERVMIVSGGDARGWALMGIPWRLITGVELVASPTGEDAVQLHYGGPPRRLPRNAVAADTLETIDFVPENPDDGERIIALIRARQV
jgi:hypothetical protein